MPIRSAHPDDVPAIQAIYAHHVLHGLSSFETEPPDAAEMRLRYNSITSAGFPYLVHTDDAGGVLGYAYANHFRTRAAYRYAVEDSIYIDPAALGRGLGKALLLELMVRCAAAGLREMLAVIGDSDNAASIGVHRACGFAHIGTMKGIGRKFDRWVDVVIMQRTLTASTPL
ncbi:MAG TPA: GNAT family N-acetyltransferase [Burkholderiaceae bacterium]|nr:GNAT family N-acetyltransferase [Burkholderiaceae bacterium]